MSPGFYFIFGILLGTSFSISYVVLFDSLKIAIPLRILLVIICGMTIMPLSPFVLAVFLFKKIFG